MRWNVYKSDPVEPMAVNLIGTVDADGYTAAVKAAVDRWPRECDPRQRNNGLRVIRTDVVVEVDRMLGRHKGPLQ